MKKFLLVIIGFLLVVGISVFFLVMGVHRTVLQHNYYEDLMNETELVDELYEVVREELPKIIIEEMGEEEDEPDFVEDLISDVFTVMLDIYDENWFKEEFLSFSSHVIDVLDGEETSLVLTIDLSERRDELRAEMITHFQTLDSEQKAEFELEDEEIEKFVDELLEDFEFLNEPIEIDLSEDEQIVDILKNFNDYRQLGFIAFGAFFFLMALFSFLLVKTAALKFLGIIMLVMSLIFAGNVLIWRSILSGFYTLIPFEVNRDVFAQVTHLTLNGFLCVPVMVGVAGLILIIIKMVFLRGKVDKIDDNFLEEDKEEGKPEMTTEENLDEKQDEKKEESTEENKEA